MRTPWILHFALTLVLALFGSALADEPLLTVGGPAIEIDVDSEAVGDIADATTENLIDLLDAVGDFICKLVRCEGTGAPQAPTEVQSVLPIPEGWEKDPRYVRITGRLPIGDATRWLSGLRVASSTLDGDGFAVEFERFAAGQGLTSVTFHQPYELPDVVLAANRLEGRHRVPAGTYTVVGTSLKIPVERMR
jgi:hypothetical protein